MKKRGSSTIAGPCIHGVSTEGDSGAHGDAAVECSRRGWQGHPRGTGKGHCPACGCFLPTIGAALIHGARRLTSGRGTPVDRARMVQIQATVVEDLGGEGAVSVAMATFVDDFAFAVVLRDLLAAHLAAVGPLTKAGKRRAALSCVAPFAWPSPAVHAWPHRWPWSRGTRHGRTTSADLSHITPTFHASRES